MTDRFVVVQKRINTRIFQLGGKAPENPAPGTVLDHTVGNSLDVYHDHDTNPVLQVTKRDWYDCFLVSQHVGQGTVSPTHYIVVHDNTGLKPDIIQKVSFHSLPSSKFHVLYLLPSLNPDQLQVDPHVLQLAGHSKGAGAVPICAQACLPGCWTNSTIFHFIDNCFRLENTFTRSPVNNSTTGSSIFSSKGQGLLSCNVKSLAV